MDKLVKIQSELNAPKNQRNNFGNYNYRSCEDILMALKPLLKENELYLTITDSIEAIGARVYVKATARLFDGEKMLCEVSAFAREAETKKGMDDAQITGACSSYARKYALNGMFLIDDNKDADTMDNSHNDGISQVDRDIMKEIERIGSEPVETLGWKGFAMDKKIKMFNWLKTQKGK